MLHNGHATTFRDDMVTSEESKKGNSDTDTDTLIVKIINEKCTRLGQIYEVLWADGRKSWIKEANLPIKVRERVSKKLSYMYSAQHHNEFGQNRFKWKFLENEDMTPSEQSVTIKDSGFGVVSTEDDVVMDEKGEKRKINCGTEKGKHKSKNHRTAGVLVFAKPCGIVVETKELFGSESKSQVYAHVHNLLSNKVMEDIGIICYDDACHLKKFAQNPVRSDLTEIAKKIKEMSLVCDKFHFRNHTDRWCKTNCNPFTSTDLENVNTEVCEQLFSWLSRFAHITKHMNRWRFLFLMLYILDCHNENTNNN